MFWNKKPDRQELPAEDSLWRAVNDLRTRVQALELANSERQVAVLNTVNKVLAQMRARERMHAVRHPDENGGQEDPGVHDLAAPGRGSRAAPDPTAHLARRFKGA